VTYISHPTAPTELSSKPILQLFLVPKGPSFFCITPLLLVQKQAFHFFAKALKSLSTASISFLVACVNTLSAAAS
jgi:hypothetical protein